MLLFRSVKPSSLTHWMKGHRNYFSLRLFQLDEITLRVLRQFIEGFPEVIRQHTEYLTHFITDLLYIIYESTKCGLLTLLFIYVICRMRRFCKRHPWRWYWSDLNAVRARWILWGSSLRTSFTCQNLKWSPKISRLMIYLYTKYHGQQ